MKRARYTTELITDSQLVTTDKCNSITFENIGGDNATIDNMIPLNFQGLPREFRNEDSNVIMENSFIIKFAGLSENKQVLITKRFYDEFSNGTNQSTKSGANNRCC